MKRVQQSLDSLLAISSEQLAQRVKMGDHLGVPRTIEHFAFFTTRAHADAAKRAFADHGYQVVLGRSWLTHELVASTEADLEPETVDAMVQWAFALVQSYGGVYDGWGGPVVQRPGEAD